MPIFTEKQRVREKWLWLSLAIGTAIMLGGLLIKGFERFDFVVLAIPGFLALGFSITHLDTRIDTTGIHYRFFPFTGWRTVAWDTIRNADVRTHQVVSYGIRWDFDGWYYVLAGQWCLRIRQTNGKCLFIGTQQPDVLRQFLADLRPAVQA